LAFIPFLLSWIVSFIPISPFVILFFIPNFFLKLVHSQFFFLSLNFQSPLVFFFHS
jgi:hypothetical protein